MAFTKFTDPADNITNQPNQPIISATALKALFDETGKDAKDYINNVLTAELESATNGDSGADNIGATALTGGVSSTVQGILEELDAKAVSGSGALTTHKASADHDGRYFTEAETTALLLANQQGNHLGAWQGVLTPSASEPGIQGVVDLHTVKLNENDMKEYNIELERFGISNNGTNPQATIDGLNSAITFASSQGYTSVYLKPGTYLVNVDSSEVNRIRMPSNMKFRLDTNAIIQVDSNSNAVYAVFMIKQKENVIIEGGQIKGDKNTHTYSGGEYQSLIMIWGSKNVTIRKMKISESPCLGIRVMEANVVPITYCENIYIYENEIFNIRSCGIAYEGVTGLWQHDNSIHNVKNDVVGSPTVGIIEQGIDCEGKMISEAYISNNDYYENEKGDILVYIPLSTPTTNANNMWILNNRCTKKIWVECDNNTTFIKIANNTVNNPTTTGNVSSVDFSLYSRGTNIELINNSIIGHARFYRLKNSIIDGLKITGKTLVFSECENSKFDNVNFISTESVFSNFNINKNTNVTYYNLTLKNTRAVIDGDNSFLNFKNVDIYGFDNRAFEIYGSGIIAGNKYYFENLTIRDRSADVTSSMLFIGSQYVDVLINNIDVRNIRSNSNNDFQFNNNTTLTIIGGYISDFNKIDAGNAGIVNSKVKIQGVYFKTSKTTNPIWTALGDMSLIITNCLFESSSVVVAIKTDTATANSVISQNTFLGCTLTSKAGDTISNNTIA